MRSAKLILLISSAKLGKNKSSYTQHETKEHFFILCFTAGNYQLQPSTSNSIP